MGDKVIKILTSTVEALAVLAGGEPNRNPNLTLDLSNTVEDTVLVYVCTKQILAARLESYFSREDMPANIYVPISTVASLKIVYNLTKDIKLITEVLRELDNVEVDTHGLRVRKRSAPPPPTASSSSLNLGQQQRSRGSALNFTTANNFESADLAAKLKIAEHHLAREKKKTKDFGEIINSLIEELRSRRVEASVINYSTGRRVGLFGSSPSNPQAHLQTSSTRSNVQASGGADGGSGRGSSSHLSHGLRESTNIQMDEKGVRMRKRTLLREIFENTQQKPQQQVIQLQQPQQKGQSQRLTSSTVSVPVGGGADELQPGLLAQNLKLKRQKLQQQCAHR